MIDDRPEVCKTGGIRAGLTSAEGVGYLGRRTMDKHPVERGIENVLKTYELLDRVRTRQALTIRDDQFEFTALLDAAAYARRRRIFMGVLDTGRFAVEELESLARQRVRILTSDEARPRPGELAIILRACRASRSFLAFLHEAALPGAGEEGPLSAQALEDLVVSGMDLHVSNRQRERGLGALAALARKARQRRSFVVHYHHGPLVPELERLGAAGAWIHFSDRSIPDEDAAGLACGIARAAAGGGSRAAVSIERPPQPEVLVRLWNAGAVLRFLTPPADPCSPLGAIERRAAKRKLPLRAAYLSDIFLP